MTSVSSDTDSLLLPHIQVEKMYLNKDITYNQELLYQCEIKIPLIE